MSTLRMVGIGALAFGLSLSTGVVRAQQDVQKDLPGPIDSLQDLQDTGRMLFKLADENNDGQISQQEAIDAGNGMVGAFFFRADTNGDGTLSREELTQARNKLLAQKPLLRILSQRAQAAQNENQRAQTQNARRNVLSLLDANNDSQIQATEVRNLVTTSVQSLYAAADTNRDGQMSPAEVNAAIAGAARAAAQASFQKADTDGNGQLSQAEFDKAIVEPANTAFKMLDSNNDGQISQQEAQTAVRIVADRLRMLQIPEPPNSPRHLLETGRRPAEVAPVPNFNTNPPARPAQPGTAPAPR
jgi:Ca2+-binding EF-hand superfamily protein